MSTKSSLFYCNKTDFHVYFEHADNEYHLSCNDADLIINEEIAIAFSNFKENLGGVSNGL